MGELLKRAFYYILENKDILKGTNRSKWLHFTEQMDTSDGTLFTWTLKVGGSSKGLS